MKTLGVVLGFLLVVFCLGFLLSWPAAWLWNNCLIPAVDGLHPVKWYQMWGILFLSGLLFKTHIPTKG
jgi:hypothetical protein